MTFVTVVARQVTQVQSAPGSFHLSMLNSGPKHTGLVLQPGSKACARNKVSKERRRFFHWLVARRVCCSWEFAERIISCRSLCSWVLVLIFPHFRSCLMALRVGMDGKFLPLQGKKLRQILPAVCIPQIFQDEPERVHNLSTQDKHRVS